MSQVLSSRVDLLGVTEGDALVHIELQSTNDPDMALRMPEYSLRIYRQFKSFLNRSFYMWVNGSRE
jgi:predicted transposase/invertase (TIGR01784 family)